MCDTYSRLLDKDNGIDRAYWEMHMNTDRDFLIMGGFIVRIFRGGFERTSGYYEINILSEQKTSSLTYNDKKKLFNLN